MKTRKNKIKSQKNRNKNVGGFAAIGFTGRSSFSSNTYKNSNKPIENYYEVLSLNTYKLIEEIKPIADRIIQTSHEAREKNNSFEQNNPDTESVCLDTIKNSHVRKTWYGSTRDKQSELVRIIKRRDGNELADFLLNKAKEGRDIVSMLNCYDNPKKQMRPITYTVTDDDDKCYYLEVYVRPSIEKRIYILLRLLGSKKVRRADMEGCKKVDEAFKIIDIIEKALNLEY